MSTDTQRPIIILGAGIIGLTTAIRVLESPLYQDKKIPVHIIADHLPNDPLDPRYASTIAGAHHLSFADDEDERQIRWDRRTFQVMYDEWELEGESTGLMVVKQTEMFVGHKKHLKIYEEHPDFSVMDPSQRSSDIDHCVSFTSLTMTPITYLNRLLLRISRLSKGEITIHRDHLPSLSSLSHPSITTIIGSLPPVAVVVCAGIGALTLGDVEDQTVFPTRGQVIKIKAPWIKSGYTRQIGDLNGGEGGERTYIIPRFDGEVILGGTREIGDWCPYPREETTRDILKRVLEICPDLSHSSETSSALDSLIVENLVGFRPSRKEGTRLERGPNISLDKNGNQVTIVIYNYGHGGAGWQSCWGTAEDAVELLMESL